MADKALKVRVVSPEATVYEGEADSITAPAWDGRVGVLAGHAPMITLLGVGALVVQAGTEVTAFHVGGGLLKVESNRVTVLTEYASEEEPPAELVAHLKLEAAGLAHWT